MDNDSAHHAVIALRMHLTGDYVTLMDHSGDYLDKPHFHFWLTAFSYKLFGVTTFAYKFPSFLFTILGTYSTFRLGRILYNAETGRLAALITASAFGYILANNDVRMDAILTACIIFSTWQLTEFIENKKIIHAAGAALGLAMGFSTKGHIAVFVPAVAGLFYILYRKNWKILLNWNWVLMAALFALFIAPVVYCYYLQYNLHPEKIVRGKDHINGVKFILLNQSVERFSGTMGSDAKHDYFFFLHSFLWAFAPWSIIAYIAVVGRIKSGFKRQEEWLTTGVFLSMLVVVSLSGFKLPHYLNVVFPTTAILTAAYINKQRENNKVPGLFFIVQCVMAVLLILGLAAINVWAFPVHSIILVTVTVLLLSLVFYYFITPHLQQIQKAVGLSVAVMILAFFLLNSNFYPRLLSYQAGKGMAELTKGKVNPADVYFWKNNFSSSYNFYSASLHQNFSDTVLKPGQTKWLAFDIKAEQEIKDAGYRLGRRFEVTDFEVTKLDIKFINPQKRDSQCSKMVLAEVGR